MSILGTDEASASILSQLLTAEDTDDSVMSQDFEAVLLGTKVYSRAMNEVIYGDSSNDNADSAVGEPLSKEVGEMVPLPTCVPDNDPSSIQNLQFVDAIAWAILDYDASLEEHLSFKRGAQIRNMCKLDDRWYMGELNGAAEHKSIGRFPRERVAVRFNLSQFVAVRTKRAMNVDVEWSQNRIYVKKGQQLQVKVSCKPCMTVIFTNKRSLEYGLPWFFGVA